MHHLSVREIQEKDFPFIVNYFLEGDEKFLLGMGVDSAKLPKREDWLALLHDDYRKAIQNKNFYYITWLLNGEAIGHSNINKIKFANEAYMHLHMWRSDVRRQGLGLDFVRLSIAYYFKNFKLKNLYCEPYALNPAPNHTLKKLGFELVEQYQGVPGWISFHQPVNRWVLTEAKFISDFDL